MDNEDLKPCPFCGSTRVFLIEEASETDRGIKSRSTKYRASIIYWWFKVSCLRCKASTNRETTKEQAISNWNRREEPNGQTKTVCF